MSLEMVNNRRLIFGDNKINEISSILQWQNLKKVFLVIYSINSEAYSKAVKSLESANIEYVVFDKIITEPDTDIINAGCEIFLKNNCDCTIAIGGGSVIDAAKSINMLSTNGGLVQEYQMLGKEVTKTPPFFIAIPTTSGTGAEATKVAVVSNNENGLKKSLYHYTMIADVAILDPCLTTGLSKEITASTAMDALSHAIEAYVSLNANILSEMYSLKAVELIAKNLETAYNQPQDIVARGALLLASYFGGCAISAGIGIAHIMAQPLGAAYKISHGDACSIFLPISMEYNLEFATKKYENIAIALGVANAQNSCLDNAKAAIEEVRRLSATINAPSSLKPYIKEEPDLDFIVDTITRTTGHITCNPRAVDANTYREVFKMAMN